ncbi:hypothetical protein CRG98_018953 [Punica granatum]|uniref:Uncharacterized protein n=1 Tax=Punica granatum TaxID=22663 RepID=A0A2I0JWL4_PUNGR|nr:hypothetical protein CRG98_018953 [Punica granatum]
MKSRRGTVGQMNLSTRKLTKMCCMTGPVTQLAEDHGSRPKMLSWAERRVAKRYWAAISEVGPVGERPNEKARVASLTRVHFTRTGINSRPEALNFLPVRPESFTLSTRDLIREGLELVSAHREHSVRLGENDWFPIGTKTRVDASVDCSRYSRLDLTAPSVPVVVLSGATTLPSTQFLRLSLIGIVGKDMGRTVEIEEEEGRVVRVEDDEFSAIVPRGKSGNG